MQNKQVVHHNRLTESVFKFQSKELNAFVVIIYKLRESGNKITFDSQEIEDYSQIFFDSHEIKKLINLKDRSYKAFEDVLDNLQSSIIELKEEDNTRRKLTLFTDVKYHDKEQKVEININNKILPLLIDLKEKFTKYSLIDFINLESKHSKRLFQLLQQWKNLKDNEKIIKIEELKKLLDVKNFETRRLNQLVEQSIKEINNKTNLKITYIKDFKTQNRKILEVKFKIEKENSTEMKDRKTVIQEYKDFYKIKFLKELTTKQKKFINVKLKEYGHTEIQIRKTP